MSGTKTSGGKASGKTRVLEAPAPPPLKPRPKVFWVLFCAWIVWAGVLLVLYFKTVYPYRNVGGGAERAPEAQANK